MSFAAKQDFFGIAGGGIVCTESNENKTASVAEARNEKGDVIAFVSFAERYEPACSYLLSADAQLSAIECGKPIAGGTGYTGKKFTCSSITINTAAGSAPTIQASGTEIPAGTTHSDCKYTFPAATLKVCHHAQILWSAFTLGGEGCFLQSANYTAGGDISTATKDGEVIAFDVANGKLEVQITVIQTSTTAPSLTAGEGWTITSPLSKSSPDADYPTWTATLSRYLTHA